eukprot:2694469-Amphidinium_carterae.1
MHRLRSIRALLAVVFTMRCWTNLQIDFALCCDARKTQSLQRLRSAAAQRQPRRSRLPPFISEYGVLFQIRSAVKPPLDASGYLTSVFHDVPVGARCLNGGDCSAQVSLWHFGLYRTPTEFLRVALRKQHPMDSDKGLHSEVLRAIQATLSLAPHELVRRRAESLSSWGEMALSMFPVCDPSSVIHGKNFELWGALLRKYAFSEPEVADEAAVGFDL